MARTNHPYSEGRAAVLQCPGLTTLRRTRTFFLSYLSLLPSRPNWKTRPNSCYYIVLALELSSLKDRAYFPSISFALTKNCPTQQSHLSYSTISYQVIEQSPFLLTGGGGVLESLQPSKLPIFELYHAFSVTVIISA
jgi:hypothetical protein